ncbi:AfsR/SARP family transcriptional regulator [Streptomyces sp. BH106]|uniref:AfsR/SARP family transcriptional regulator n=1 Tax=Streptomyces sp. BH106 TaxID=3410409 RepID=UPI003CEB5DD8
MWFGVLGPLAVLDGEGEPVKVPEAKVRALLADLLVHEGRVVSTGRLVDDLWGEALPGKPTGALQAKVSQLRRAVGRERVVHQARGYRLAVADDEVDALRFRSLTERAGRCGAPRERVALLDEALGLWRGTAYADFADEEFAAGAARQLEDLRVGALEERAEARLSLGELTGLAAELGDLVERYPLRERLRGAHIRALGLAGRQTEALASYEELRVRLVGELGVDPGPELTALHEAVLRQERGVVRRPPPRVEALADRPPSGGEEGEGVPGVGPSVVPDVSGAGPTGVSGTRFSVASDAGEPRASVAPDVSEPRSSAAPDAREPRVSVASVAWDPRSSDASDVSEPRYSVGPVARGPRVSVASVAWDPRSSDASDVSEPRSSVGPVAWDPRSSDASDVSEPRSSVGPVAWDPRSSDASDVSEPRYSAGPVARESRASVAPDASGLRVSIVAAAGLSSLVGRDRAMSDLVGLLTRTRLLSLVGPGGVGKTRLALAVAACRQDGDTAVVELAGRQGDVTDLAETVAATLGIREEAVADGRGPVERLGAALRDRRILLVLDNCEHVVEAAAELAALLLRAAPGLRILATSQEPLSIAGETVFAVEPLSPADAVRLFTERATAAAPGFDPASAADAVAEICRRLDGIPLALELAATRVRTLGVRELAARLSDRFRVLTAGQRGAPARQRTLRAMIDWSWGLLGAPERIVLRRLAVHRDGCTPAAAETVCAGEGIDRDEVLELLTRLVDRSLVVMNEGPEGPRYRLLESIAAYATERLAESDDLPAVRDRHLHHYLALAEQAAPLLHGPDQQLWLARLDAESANFRAAFSRADAPAHARLTQALVWWWLLRGRLSEARRALAGSTESDGSVRPSALPTLRTAFTLLAGERPTDPAPALPADARTAWLLAYALFNANYLPAAERVNDHVLAAITDDPTDTPADVWATAAALGLRAALALARDQLTSVEADARRSADLFGELGDRWGELLTVNPLASLAAIKGDYAEAERRERAGLDIARALGLPRETAARFSGLGRLALLAQDFTRAHDLHEEARQLAVEQGYTYDEVHSLMGLALGARRAGELDAAEGHLRHIRDRHVSTPVGEHLLHAELGFTAELRGDRAGAERHHRRALEMARALGEPRALALSLEGLAGAATLAPASPERAALLLGAAAAARNSVGAPLPPAERADVDRITAAAKSALGEPAFTEAFTKGVSTPPEQVASTLSVE